MTAGIFSWRFCSPAHTEYVSTAAVVQEVSPQYRNHSAPAPESRGGKRDEEEGCRKWWRGRWTGRKRESGAHGKKAQPGKSDYPAHCVLARLDNLIPYI